MIKLRLHGERSEILTAEEIICNSGKFRVLNISDYYKDRGNSIYERVYMDLEIIAQGNNSEAQTAALIKQQ